MSRTGVSNLLQTQTGVIKFVTKQKGGIELVPGEPNIPHPCAIYMVQSLCFCLIYYILFLAHLTKYLLIYHTWPADPTISIIIIFGISFFSLQQVYIAVVKEVKNTSDNLVQIDFTCYCLFCFLFWLWHHGVISDFLAYSDDAVYMKNIEKNKMPKHLEWFVKLKRCPITPCCHCIYFPPH